jgi:hypothetical protein
MKTFGWVDGEGLLGVEAHLVQQDTQEVVRRVTQYHHLSIWIMWLDENHFEEYVTEAAAKRRAEASVGL